MKIYTITAYSNESEDFEMQISAHEKILFSELHQAIQKALDYDPLQMASFFKCNDEWEKLEELALIDMGDSGSQKLMEESLLSDILASEGDQMLYLFDFFSERSFFLSVTSIKESDNVIFSIDVSGHIPLQIKIDSEGIDNLMNDFEGTQKSDDDSFDNDYGDDSISFENIDDLEDY